MKRVLGKLKTVNILAWTNFLTVMAVTFAVRSCHGKIYEPKVPKKLQ